MMRRYDSVRRSSPHIFAAVLLLLVQGCDQSPPETAPADKSAIAAADRAYVDAWLTNNPEQVMATLTDYAVMVPSGLPTLEGPDAIRRFWWPPDAAPSSVTRFEITQSDTVGSGDLGYVRGSFTLEFDYDGTHYARAGNYLSVLRKDSDGTWRISQRMWNDHPLEDE